MDAKRAAVLRHSNYFEEMRAVVSVGHSNMAEPATRTRDYHFHNNYEIILFLQGNAEAYVEQSRYPLERGSLFVVNSREIHKIHTLDGSSYERIVIHFPPVLIQEMNTRRTDLLSCFHSHSPGSGNAVLLSGDQIDIFLTLAGKLSAALTDKNYGQDLLVNAYLAEILIMIHRIFEQTGALQALPIGTVVSKIMEYVDEHLGEKISLDRVAKDFSLSKYYLGHLFRTQTGGSLYHYILLKKIAAARQILSDGGSVEEAAEQTGFMDYNNFIRTFKRYTGVTPGRFRKLPRQ